jgi:hypothetical protein
MPKQFFPRRLPLKPTIYAYEDTNPQYAGLLKVGYTALDAQKRVAEQYPTKKPGSLPYKIVLEESAMRNDGSFFIDHDVHRHLKSRGILNPAGEWFKCTAADVRSSIIALRTGNIISDDNRSADFKMRPEQQEAVEKTIAYFTASKKDSPDKTPHFLWNAKMRFGKTFAAYKLAKQMKWSKVLVLTFKPAVQSAWEEDLKTHTDFAGWQFIACHDSTGGTSFPLIEYDKSKPLVCFGSFQDLLGKNSLGGIKAKNEWIHATNWDCVILDEYHYGAWRENAKDLFEDEDSQEAKFGNGEGLDYFDEDIMPITTDAYLYLSGTPFRAIASGEFIEDQIYNWTYSDEQAAKENWKGLDNPYAALPRMVMMTYQLPPSIRKIALGGEYNEFDLNTFFSAEGSGDNAFLKYQAEMA